MTSVVRVGDDKIFIACAMCKSGHLLNIDASKRPRWIWDGDTENPTITPSVRATYHPTVSGKSSKCCHFILTKGVMHFCGDTTNKELANKDVRIPALSEDELLFWSDR